VTIASRHKAKTQDQWRARDWQTVGREAITHFTDNDRHSEVAEPFVAYEGSVPQFRHVCLDMRCMRRIRRCIVVRAKKLPDRSINNGRSRLIEVLSNSRYA